MSDAAAGMRWYGTRRPGAVEKVLERAMGGDHTPYEWIVRSVSRSATTVLDVACSSGGLTRRLAAEGRRVTGLDASMSNIRAARALSDEQFVLADVDRLPFADGSFDAVVTCLGLGVSANRASMLSEVSRVLRPGGVFASLMPSLRPVAPSDLALLSRLAGFLRVAPQLPGSAEFQAKRSLGAAGLTKVEDTRGRFFFEVRNQADATTLVDGLRPAPDRSRAQDAIGFLVERAGDLGVRVPLPMRRIVAIK